MTRRFACPRPSASFKIWLVATSALAWPVLFASEPALAQTCEPLDGSGNATCSGTFSSNIDVNTNNTPIHLTLAPGVIVNSPGGDGAVNLANIQTATTPPFAAA